MSQLVTSRNQGPSPNDNNKGRGEKPRGGRRHTVRETIETEAAAKTMHLQFKWKWKPRNTLESQDGTFLTLKLVVYQALLDRF